MNKYHIPEEFIRLFPITSNATLKEQFQVSVPTIHRWAKTLGITKDSDYKRAMHRNRALGHTVSEETRKRIGQKALGRKRPQGITAKIMATKQRNGTILKKEHHPMWKGGNSLASRHTDPAYQQWRLAVLERDQYCCQDCGKQGTGRKRDGGLHAHHLKSYTKFPTLRYDIPNGLTLCRKCHSVRHKIPFTKPPVPIEYIACACGCGTIITQLNKRGQPRRFLKHHTQRGRRNGPAELEKISRAMTGRTLTPEHKAKISAAMQKRELTRTYVLRPDRPGPQKQPRDP